MRTQIDTPRSSHLFAVLVLGWALGWGMGRGADLRVARADEAAGAPTASLEARVAALETKLAPLSRKGDDLYITRANLHILNGLGGTDTTNGLGNLIVGYNELRDDKFNTRTGSHYLIVGKCNNYSSYGGVAFGLYNHPSGPYATACGGSGNKPIGFAAAIAGGRENVASGQFSVVSGGNLNASRAEYATVSGGRANSSEAAYATVGGGKEVHVRDIDAWSAPLIGLK